MESQLCVRGPLFSNKITVCYFWRLRWGSGEDKNRSDSDPVIAKQILKVYSDPGMKLRKTII